MILDVKKDVCPEMKEMSLYPDTWSIPKSLDKLIDIPENTTLNTIEYKDRFMDRRKLHRLKTRLCGNCEFCDMMLETINRLEKITVIASTKKEIEKETDDFRQYMKLKGLDKERITEELTKMRLEYKQLNRSIINFR